MKKDRKNLNVVTCKLEPALTRGTNPRLEVSREERQKREKMVERRKIEAMVAKYQKSKERISLSSKEEKNYESNTRDKTDQDQDNNDENSLELWEGEAGRNYKWEKWFIPYALEQT